jgi:uncharacterized protein (TIGR00156 family)
MKFSGVCAALMVSTVLASSMQADAQRLTGPFTPISSVFQMPDDAMVVIRGEVVRQIEEDEYIVRDNSGSIVIDVDDDRKDLFGIGVGQIVSVRGIVDIGLFRAKNIQAREVEISNPEVTTSPDPSARRDIRSIWEVYTAHTDGEIVTVAGTIVRRLDEREFIIRDRSGEIIVDAQYHRFHELPLNVGSKLIVTGELDIYWGGPWREVEAHNITLQEELAEVVLPNQLVATPIAEVLSAAKEGEMVTVSGVISRRLDQDDFLFTDTTGDILVKADQRIFSHHGLAEGRKYLVTGKIKRNLDGTIELIAILITADMSTPPPAAPNLDIGCNEVPISSVFYDTVEGQVVCIAGTIIRILGPGELLVQDDSGGIVVHYPPDKYQSLNLKVGSFIIVSGIIHAPEVGGTDIHAENIFLRQRN